jgi:hypothetical protein
MQKTINNIQIKEGRDKQSNKDIMKEKKDRKTKKNPEYFKHLQTQNKT